VSANRVKAALCTCLGLFVIFGVLYQLATNHVFTGGRLGPPTWLPVSRGGYLLVIETLVALPGTIMGILGLVQDQWFPSLGNSNDDDPPSDPY
jgi:hypothetical protein